MSFLSILIPTHNGNVYVEKLIKSVLEEEDEDIELIVSFNQSNGAPNWSKEINDKRFRYLEPRQELSMAKNYEYLIQAARYEWILIIGDDDGVKPNFIKNIKNVIKKFPNQDIHYFKRAYFYWPNMTKLNFNAYVVFAEGTKSKKIKIKTEFNKLLWGLIEFQNLPQAYVNTVFNQRVLSKWKLSHNHNLYNEMNPDIYSSVVFSRLRDIKIMKHNSIINIVGTSKKSIGIAKKDPYGKIQLRANEFLNMNKKDGVNISPLVGEKLWLHGDTRILISSCILQLPNSLKINTFDYKFIKITFLSLYLNQLIRIIKIKNYHSNKIILNEIKTFFLKHPLNKYSDIAVIIISLMVVLIKPFVRIYIELRLIFSVAFLLLKSQKSVLIVRNNRIKNTHVLYRFLRLRAVQSRKKL